MGSDVFSEPMRILRDIDNLDRLRNVVYLGVTMKSRGSALFDLCNVILIFAL
jgi:hypothetical protein